MKRFAHIRNLAFWAIFAIPGSLFAQYSSQVKYLVGISAGYDFYGYTTAWFDPLSTRPGFFGEDGGSGSAPFYALSAEFPISSGLDKFITVDLGYDQKSGDFTSGARYDGDSLVNESAKLSFAVLNLGFKYNMEDIEGFPSMFGLQGYISFGYPIQHRLITYIDSGALFNINSLKPLKPIDANIDGLRTLNIAAGIALTYDIPLSPKCILTPSLMDEFPLTKVDNTSRNWTINSFYLGAALRFVVR